MDGKGRRTEGGDAAEMGGLGDRFGKSVWLASRSPRRRALLEEYGYDFAVAQSDLDDGELHPGSVDPAAWVMSLAYLKATAALRVISPESPLRPVLGADTICVVHGEIIGQPTDAADATRILTLVSGCNHEVLTGVAIVCPKTAHRDVFYERTTVTVGDLTEMIPEYVCGGQWRGKAGAYNLAERLEAGWPIEYAGDPTSIMGLPMKQLETRLSEFCRLILGDHERDDEGRVSA